MPQQQSNRFEDLTFREKIKIIQILSRFPAITIMVFIRRRLGFRMMNPQWLMIMTAIMFVIPTLLPGPYNPMLSIYALGVFALGMYQRWLRWCELCNGVMWHTYSSGITILEIIPWPDFLRRERRIYRKLDPILCAVAGVLLMSFSNALGLWVIFSALCLAVYEEDCYQMALTRDLDLLDSLFEAEIQSQTVKFFKDGPKGGTAQAKALTLEQTGGIPTGLAPDITHQIELRKARQRALGLDNLVEDSTGASTEATTPAPAAEAGAETPGPVTGSPAPDATTSTTTPDVPPAPKAPDNLAAPGPDNLA